MRGFKVELTNRTRKLVSVIVHTRNEESNIVDCLKSCELLPAELIVADMESTDRTVDLARANGARIVQLPLEEEFDASRNVSAQSASCDWILYLDADERLTPTISQTIIALLNENDPTVAGYALPFKVISFEKWIQHAGNWWPSYKSPPLLRNGKFRFPGPVHMPAEVNGRVVKVQPRNDEDAILHFSHPNLTHYFDKLNRYTSLEALKQGSADPLTWQEIAISFGRTFAWYYDTTGGKRDGKAGFFLSVGSGIYEAVSRLKSAEKEGLDSLPGSAADFLAHAAQSAASEAATQPRWVSRLTALLDASSTPRGHGIVFRSAEEVEAVVGETTEGTLLVSRGIASSSHPRLGKPLKLLMSRDQDPHSLWFVGETAKASLRVAMITHGNALGVLGGGEVQVFQTAKHLRDLAVHCDVFVGKTPPTVSNYDLLHYFSLHHDQLPDQNRPAILTPITFDRRELVTIANQIPHLFRVDNKAAEIDSGFAYLRAQAAKLKDLSESPLLFGDASYVTKFRHVAVNCQVEANTILRLSKLKGGQISVVPNGIDPHLANWKPDLDCSERAPYILCVGRIEPNKNQLSLIWALRGSGINLLLVGDVADEDYGRACRRISDDHVRFLGPKPTSVVRNLMCKAMCHVLPSFGETPGLASLEAAALKCPIVVSDRGGEREYFGDLAAYCDSLDPKSIATAVSKAMRSTVARRDRLKNKVLSEYSWKQVASATRNLYLAVIEDWKRNEPNS